jgi:predicted permease
MRNLRLAFRTLVKSPFVTAIAVLSLALGIGANAAIFSAFDQMLLSPLPVNEPERLVNVNGARPNPGSQNCGQAGDCDVVFSYPMFRDLEKANTQFSGLAAHVQFGANIAYDNKTLNGGGLMVSGSYFPVLGVKPALGRLLSPADDQTIGGHFVTVLSYAYWANQLGADAKVLDRNIVINGQSYTIVGVTARDFEGTTLGSPPVLYVPVTMRTALQPLFKDWDDRRSYSLYLFARLRPGVTIEQAKTAVNAVYHPIINDVEAPLQTEMSDQTMAKFRAKEVALEDGRRGQSTVRREAKTSLGLLFATTAIVLLIACANIANLLLARAAGRATEMAIRLSLGATRTQLLRQLLTESFVLAALGGVASLVVAKWTIGLINGLLPGEIASALHISLHLQSVWFAGALSLGTGLLFGLFPALHSTRPDLDAVLRSGSGKLSDARSASRFRSVLVTSQIALSMALLISAGLFVKSLNNISRVDLGLKVDDVVTFGVSPSKNGYEFARARTLFANIHDALIGVPGVTGASTAAVPLLAGNNWGNSVSVQGFKKGPDTDTDSRVNEIGPDYFKVLGVPMIAGREFTESDVLGAPKVAIVNETFAKKFGLGRDAVGKFMGRSRGDTLDLQIVGLVKDAKYSQVKNEVPPVFFMPVKQDSTMGQIHFYVRGPADSRMLLRAIQGVVARLDPNLPVEGLKTLPQQVRENVFLDRMIGTLSALFALLATLLAAVGLYGVLSYSVAQRSREIGVRMALGADGSNVRGMVLRQVGLMTLIGGTIGIAGAIALGRAARSMLFGLEGHDPLVIAASAAALTLVAFGAGYIPARRASRVDPMQALRYE